MTDQTYVWESDDGIPGKIEFRKDGVACGPAGGYIVCFWTNHITIDKGPGGPGMEVWPDDDDIEEIASWLGSDTLRLRASTVPIADGWDEVHLFNANDPNRHYVIIFEPGDDTGVGERETVQ